MTYTSEKKFSSFQVDVLKTHTLAHGWSACCLYVQSLMLVLHRGQSSECLTLVLLIITIHFRENVGVT